jgi:serine phosphatase RsbU (regulator of sigma subunit)
METESPLVYQQKVARLQSLLEATRALHSSIQIEEVLLHAVTIAVKELEVPGAFIRSVEEDSSIPPISYGQVPEGFRDHPGAGPGVSLFPLTTKEGAHLAHLAVVSRPDRELDLEERDFLEGLALQASLAVQNARFHEESLRWERVRRDLETARAIQQSLVPQTMPEIPGYLLAARSVPCYEVGGDYLDIMGLPDGSILMVVADVAGKGLASALVGSSFRASTRAMASAGVPLAEMAARMNDLHFEDGEEARRKYVTTFLARLSPATHELRAVNAGHNPCFLAVPGGVLREIRSSGTPLGMLPDRTYREEVLVFPPGATLFLYTDGLSEASKDGEEFGKERLLGLLERDGGGDPAQILDLLWAEVDAFEDKMGPLDDKTALALKRSL